MINPASPFHTFSKRFEFDPGSLQCDSRQCDSSGYVDIKQIGTGAGFGSPPSQKASHVLGVIAVFTGPSESNI